MMIVLALLLLVLVAAVAFFNTEMITLNLYFASLSIPLWMALVGALLLGMVIAGLLASSAGARNRQVIKNKNREIERTEEEKIAAVERVKQESANRTEMLKKEAEIQRLQSERPASTNVGSTTVEQTRTHGTLQDDPHHPNDEVYVEERVEEHRHHNGKPL